MRPNPLHRLPLPLETAIQRLKLAAREATERTIESLGLAALSANHTFQRDGLLAAQFELNRKSAVFVLTFNDAFDQRALRELAPRAGETTTSGAAYAGPRSTSWDALSLVDDREVEAQISAERFAMEIAHSCEWELRELDGYVSSLLGQLGADRERNPLRPEIIGHALMRGVDAISDSDDVRKVLSTEIGRSLGALLRNAYAQAIGDLRKAGIQPQGLAVRARSAGAAGPTTGREATGLGADSRAMDLARAQAVPGGGSRQGGMSGMGGGGSGAGVGSQATLGQVDPQLMSLIRRIAFAAPQGAGGSIGDSGSAGWDVPSGPLPNLIHAHRDELRRASTGALDHMVIDVIGFLFDQILTDAKLPPQMARLIARLQLPVLRAALGDASFFSSRRHPVRRFVNRIASLGTAFEDFSDETARAFLGRVRTLINDVVEGDFDQIATYERQLAELERLAAEQGSREVREAGADAELLQQKEDELRLRQVYAQRLAGELNDVAVPPFVRHFLAQVWSQVLLRAATLEPGKGAEGAVAQRLRKAGRELVLSVQPKPSPAHRKAFLAELPKLMQDLTEGLQLIGWPEAERRAFFGQLMPTHAEALKSTAAPRQLDLNLMALHVEGALEKLLPSREELRSLPELPVLDDVVAAPVLTAEEAQRVGLVDEAAVDWNGQIDIDLSEPAPAAERSAPLPGLPALADAPDPVRGRDLAAHVEVGFAYQMHLHDRWQKVRLSHVSPGRAFFMFTQGGRHKKTLSMTQRMLVKLCETGRFRAIEEATLLERATERARRQLAALRPRPA